MSWARRRTERVVDDPGMEPLTGSREDAGFVERFGDTGLGVVVEEAVDLGDDGRRCGPGLRRGQPV